VIAVLDGLPDGAGQVVLAGHSYGGLVARQAADRRPGRVAHVVLVDGWAGGDGESLLDLAPTWFGDAVRAGAGPPAAPAARLLAAGATRGQHDRAGQSMDLRYCGGRRSSVTCSNA
jgi:pimeloyl-ACP methyl ester carboxylesterase